MQHDAGRRLPDSHRLLEPPKELVEILDRPGSHAYLVVEASGDVDGVDHIDLVPEGVVDASPRDAGGELEVDEGIRRTTDRSSTDLDGGVIDRSGLPQPPEPLTGGGQRQMDALTAFGIGVVAASAVWHAGLAAASGTFASRLGPGPRSLITRLSGLLMLGIGGVLVA